MKCGFCLSQCPVYLLEKSELRSPRGRNMVIQKIRRGQMAASDRAYQESVAQCLSCGQCGRVCPARLASDRIVLDARSALFEAEPRGRAQRFVNRLLLRPGDSTRAYRRYKRRVAAVRPELAEGLFHYSEVAGRGNAVKRGQVDALPKRVAVPPGTAVVGRVAIFAGCLVRHRLPQLARDAAELLARLGYEVDFPGQAVCCGEPVMAMGDRETALSLARANLTELSRYTHVLTLCGSCRSGLRRYPAWFGPETTEAAAAAALGETVVDLVEWLAPRSASLAHGSATSLNVVFHEAWATVAAPAVAAAHRRLLQSLEGLTLIELPLADACCKGGTAQRPQRDERASSAAESIGALHLSRADAVVTSCPSCLLTLSSVLADEKSAMKVMHTSEMIRNRPEKRRRG